MNRVCPMMSRPIVIVYGDDSPTEAGLHEVQCLQNKCQWWTHVYTSEGYDHAGCSLELLPNMAGGAFRV